MEAALAKLLSFPPHPPPPIPLTDAQYDEAIKQQIEMLRKMPDKTLLSSTSSGENPLDIINPSLNSVPYLLILRARLHAATKGKGDMDLDQLFLHVVNFLQNFDPRQIRYLGVDFTGVLESAVQLARQGQQLNLSIPLLMEAILRLDPSSSVLTSSHLLLVSTAIEAEDYVNAQPVLSQPIMYIPTSQSVIVDHLCDLSLPSTAWITSNSGFATKMKACDILEYFILSAMVLIGAHDWESALQCLENAISYPTKEASVSKIMVEAYKKWVLVSTLHAGHVLPLPKSTSAVAARTYHTIGKPYEAVAALFEVGTAARFRAEIEVGSNIWAEDQNVGLMSMLLVAFQRWQIRHLAKTYTKIAVADVAEITISAETLTKLPIADVEAMIRSMIDDGSLHATISDPTATTGPILTFLDLTSSVDEAQLSQELARATYRIKALTQEVQTTDRALAQHRSYIDNSIKNRLKGKQGGGTQSAAELLQMMGSEMDWNSVVEDEDIMTAF